MLAAGEGIRVGFSRWILAVKMKMGQAEGK